MRFLVELLPNFFPVHGHIFRSGDAQPYRFSFDREDGDRQLLVRHHNSFTGLATEDEHESSSVSESPAPVPAGCNDSTQSATAFQRERETETM
jgi:hypothetical protein